MKEDYLQQSHASEESVLCSLLSEPKCIDDCSDLSPGDFSSAALGDIFSVISKLSATAQVVDDASVLNLLRGSGVRQAFLGLLERVVTSAGIKHHAGIVLDLSRLRSASMAAERASIAFSQQGADFDTVAGGLDASMTKLVGLTRDELPEDMAEALPRTIAAIDSAKAGIPTGFSELDRIFGGFQEAEMTVLGAPPSMGKSALGSAMCVNAAEHGVPSAFISIEMSQVQLITRILCVDAEIDSRKIATGLSATEQKRLAMSAGKIAQLPIRIIDQDCFTMTGIRAKARKAVREMGAKLIVVDYLQLIASTSNKGNRAEVVGEQIQGLKLLAKELNVSLVVLSQLSRQNQTRPDKRPILADLRDSGAIEAASDKVFFLHSEAYYDPARKGDAGEVEVIVSKNRTGALGTARLSWEPTFTKFTDLTYSPTLGGPLVTSDGQQF